MSFVVVAVNFDHNSITFANGGWYWLVQQMLSNCIAGTKELKKNKEFVKDYVANFTKIRISILNLRQLIITV